MSDPTKASSWARKADEDLVVVDILVRGGDPLWDAVVYHAQQAAEKLLKALLVSRGEVLPKVHDLTKLLTLCVAYEPDLATFMDDCFFLSPLAVRSRYPDEEAETAREDAERCAAIARGIRSAVLARLPPEAQ